MMAWSHPCPIKEAIKGMFCHIDHPMYGSSGSWISEKTHDDTDYVADDTDDFTPNDKTDELV